MTASVLAALIRAALQVSGAAGVLEGEQLTQAAGALAIIVSLVWSVLEKMNRPR